MNLRRVGFSLGVCVLLLGLGNSAKAQWGWGGGWGLGGGFGIAAGAYTLNPPPYFSMFPPVYYSHPTPRPYGFSPYAYPGFMPTPERIRMPSTPWVPNVRRQVAPRPASEQTAAKPVIIKNPFVLPEAERPTHFADGRPVPQNVSPTSYATASRQF